MEKERQFFLLTFNLVELLLLISVLFVISWLQFKACGVLFLGAILVFKKIVEIKNNYILKSL